MESYLLLITDVKMESCILDPRMESCILPITDARMESSILLITDARVESCILRTMDVRMKGRICLISTMAFGVCITLLIDFLHPFILHHLDLLPSKLLNFVTIIIYTVFVADITLTVTGLIGLKERLELLQKTLTEQMQKEIDLTEEKRRALFERIESSQIYRERLQKLTVSAFTSRFVENFPKLKSERYEDALEKVKEMRRKR